MTVILMRVVALGSIPLTPFCVAVPTQVCSRGQRIMQDYVWMETTDNLCFSENILFLVKCWLSAAPHRENITSSPRYKLLSVYLISGKTFWMRYTSHGGLGQ